MALCSNASSLLELSFGVNAVIAVLTGKVATTRSRLAELVIANFQAVDPNFKLAPDELPHLERWVSLTLRGFRIVRTVCIAPQVLASALVAIAAATLYQSAIWGDKCTIDDTVLLWLSTTALLIAPVVYYGFGQLVEFVERLITTRTFENKTEVASLLSLYRLSVSGRKELREFDVMIQNLERQEAKIALQEIRSNLSQVLHPIAWTKDRFRAWRMKKLVRELTEEA